MYDLWDEGQEELKRHLPASMHLPPPKPTLPGTRTVAGGQIGSDALLKAHNTHWVRCAARASHTYSHSGRFCF